MQKQLITGLLALLWLPLLQAEQSSPFLVVLGVVQDAGYPQIGNYAPHSQPG